MDRVQAVIIPFTLANLADYITTVVGLQNGFHELNSLVASLDPFTFLALKILIVLSLSFLLMSVLRLKSRSSIAKGVYIGLVSGILISTAVISIAALHNIMILAGFPENETLIKIVSEILI